MDDRVNELGSVKYVWVPRANAVTADRLCNEEMDKMERKRDSD